MFYPHICTKPHKNAEKIENKLLSSYIDVQEILSIDIQLINCYYIVVFSTCMHNYDNNEDSSSVDVSPILLSRLFRNLLLASSNTDFFSNDSDLVINVNGRKIPVYVLLCSSVEFFMETIIS